MKCDGCTTPGTCEAHGCAVPTVQVCCGKWAECATPCVPRANHWQDAARRLTERVNELQAHIAQRALDDRREQERRQSDAQN